MAFLKSVLVFLAVGYGGVVALVYLAQRTLLYFPDRSRTPPAEAGFPQAEEITIQTGDGEKLVAWYVKPADGKSIVIYVHGNGGALVNRVRRFRGIVADGDGLFAISYRGYGGSTGSPSEKGLLADAEAGYAFAAARFPAKRIAVFGESLGTGVAIWLASEKPVARVLLQAPYTSVLDLGAAAYWFLPVRWLAKDTYRSDEWVARVSAPVLVLHGARDRVVPIEYGERLFELIRAPKKFVRFPEGGHVNLDDFGALDIIRAFLAEPAP